MPASEQEQLLKLLSQREPYAAEQISELRNFTTAIARLGDDWRTRAQFRSSIETIAAIKEFDKVSGNLVATTNKLTTRIFWLTVVALVLGGIQVAEGLISLFSTK
jgi:hypothetical protein